MKLGATVVNNEQLNQDQIKVKLNKLELKYRLDGLPEKHKEIKRKPTKAENEEQVSEEDRKLHERIAAEVKAKLEAKGKSTEGVETFEEFYGLLQSEAMMLQKKYQPQLRKGIKIAVDLVNSVQQDKKDEDVDIKIKIAPNTFEIISEIIFEGNPNKESQVESISEINNDTEKTEKFWGLMKIWRKALGIGEHGCIPIHFAKR